MGKLQIIVGGQYGSEAKGAICAWLALQEDTMLAMRVAGPNAGHTVVDPLTNRHIALRHIPVAAVVNPHALLALAPGSEIDPLVLQHEIDLLQNEHGINITDRLSLDPQATWLTHEHIEAERTGSISDRIGSTAKGIGAARADRLWRKAPLISQHPDYTQYHENVADLATNMLQRGVTVQIEGTQGYGLGLHAGHYPQCTSSDARAIDFAAMAGITPWAPYVTELETWIVLRTHPIRVAGNSGPLRNETNWETLSTQMGRTVEERTTVTQKIRRVGEWDIELAREAIHANGGPSTHVKVALTFVDYIFPELANQRLTADTLLNHPYMRTYLDELEAELGQPIATVSVGPNTEHTIDLRKRTR